MKKVFCLAAVGVLFFLLLLSGCQNIRLPGNKEFDKVSSRILKKSMKQPSASNKMLAESGAFAPDDKAENALSAQIARKIIYSSEIAIEVGNVPKSIEEIKRLTKNSKGYVQNSSTVKDENKRLSGYVLLRIPPSNLEAALSGIKKIGDVVSESMYGQDITKKYYDLDARLKNSKRFESRLLKLLDAKANKVSDLLQVEKELSRVRTEIESIQGVLRYYKNMVGLANVTVNLYEKGVNIPSRGNIFQPVVDTFVSAVNALFESVGIIIILAFALFPWFLLVGIILYMAKIIWKNRKLK